ncbi:hypothetical protein [Nocardioides sp.]|uniref:hypothetical protein n=1 Tax=Nocardioides sp. TaxID=35761 RepID=UPI00356989D4
MRATPGVDLAPAPATAAGGLPLAARLLIASLLAGGAGVVGALALWLPGSDPTEEALATMTSGTPLLVIGVAAGALLGAVLAWGVAGRRRLAIRIGALLGAVLAVVVCSSYGAHLF